jgi:hypothetical protein
MTVNRVWTIEIDGDSKKYKTINFDRVLEIDAPPTFNAKVAYDETINFWDPVEIKRDGTIEFKGYVEGIEIDWGSQDRYLNISGRDVSVILWKKYGEGFTEMDETLGGFFGKVSAVELLQFLIRCPQSDPVSTYPNNKAGWGIDISRITNVSAYRTSIGAPEWTILRKKGLGWRNSGTPFGEDINLVSSNVTEEWQEIGDTGIDCLTGINDGKYITSGTADAISEWEMENLPAEATSISNPRLQLYWATDWTYWWWIQAEFDCYIWIQSLNTWQWLFHQTGRDLGWTYLEYDLSSVITTIADLNAAKIKFINRSTTLKSKIDYCAIAVTYVTSGTQNTDDYFEIDFTELENICGIYFESRNDDESFPINYKIVTVGSDLEDFIEYTEVDPNTHISKTANHIDFDAYNDEDAYLYYDFGANHFGDFKQEITFKCVTDPVPEPHVGYPEMFGVILGFWALTNDLDDLLALEFGITSPAPVTFPHLSLSVWRDPSDIINGGAPTFRLHETYGDASAQSDYSPEFDEGKTYKFEIIRVGTSITVSISEDGIYFDTLSLTMGQDNDFRYLMACVTANTGEITHCDVDIDNLIFTTETTIVSEVTNNTFRDIIHSWQPQTLDNLKIKITSADATHGWAISQIYVYYAPVLKYRVYLDGLTAPALPPPYLGGPYIKSIWSVATTKRARASNVTTITTASVHGLLVGDGVKIVGLGGTGYNGTWTVASVPTITTFTYANTGSDEAETSDTGGTVTDYYATSIGPLNIAMERLIDSINSIVSKCHNTHNPYKWWMAYDTDNTFRFKARRGSDKSGTISFVKGTNLGGVTRTKHVESTVQRIKIIGRGEGQRQEKVSSDWQEDEDAMDEIRGFYEDVETQKVQANKDLTDLMALIKLKESASIEDQSTINVNKDTCDSMAYDVGDDVTITDSLTGLSGAKTIYNITKDIDENGEQITLVVGKAWKTQEDEWADIYRRLKELGIVGTVANDWSGEGTNESKVDATKVSDTWEQSASHEDVEIGGDKTDPQWYKNPDPANNIEITGDKMGLYGPDSGSGVQSYEIEMRWDKKVSTAFPDGLTVEFNISLTREPKLICEGYCYQVESGDTKYWKEGDYVVFGLYNLQTDIGFLFKIVKGASAFTVYARYKRQGIWIDSPIRTITSNRKYRFEMYYNKTSQAFYWNVYDIENEQESDPVSYVIIKPDNVTVLKPLYAKIVADHNDTTTLWARFYIFRLKTEWSRYEY